MSEKYSTDELVEGLVLLRDHGMVNLSFGGVDEFIDIVIARLRAADKLCEAAESVVESREHLHGKNWFAVYQRAWDDIRKAIVAFEGKGK